MAKPRFDIDSLARRPDVLACIVPADQLFAWLARSVEIPAGWVALAAREGQDPLVVKGGHCYTDDDTQDVLFARVSALPCTAEEAHLRSSDGFECTGTLSLRVSILPDKAELAAFRKTVLGSSSGATVSDLQRYLHVAMGKVLGELASCHSAGELLQSLEDTAVQPLVNEILGPVCLAAGLEIDGPASVRFDSPAYRDHCRHHDETERRHDRQQARVRIQEALDHARERHLSNLVRMLEQMRDAGDRHGDLSIQDLLRSFSEAERGEMYAALWQLCPGAGSSRFVAAVSGNELLLFAPDDIARPARRIGLPDVLGPLRSVTADRRSVEAGVVIVGAATGVLVVDIDSGDVRQVLHADVQDGQSVRGGVNAAAMSDDRIFATHSELGLMAWPRDAASGTRAASLCTGITADASAVRCAQVADGTVWFTAGPDAWSLDLRSGAQSEPVRYGPGGDTLSALKVAESTVYAGNVDGQVMAWEMGQPQAVRIIRGRAEGPVESIHLVSTGGVDRLVIAGRGSALLAMVMGDNYVCRYEAAGQLVRRAAAADDLFVAMNDSRDRLIAWKPDQPDRPIAGVIIPHLTGTALQDVCIVPCT